MRRRTIWNLIFLQFSIHLSGLLYLQLSQRKIFQIWNFKFWKALSKLALNAYFLY